MNPNNHARRLLLSIGACVALVAGAASAHHSFAMFDTSRTKILVGEIKEFQWTNPHSWIQVVVVDDKGASQEWSIESLSTGTLSRQGMRPKTFQPGDKVTMTIYPMKDGSPGGSFINATMADGRVIGKANP
jgi:Family of unknown function (DUF6152)